MPWLTPAHATPLMPAFAYFHAIFTPFRRFRHFRYFLRLLFFISLSPCHCRFHYHCFHFRHFIAAIIFIISPLFSLSFSDYAAMMIFSLSPLLSTLFIRHAAIVYAAYATPLAALPPFSFIIFFHDFASFRHFRF